VENCSPKYLLRYTFHFFKVIPLVAFGKIKITTVLKGRSSPKKALERPAEVPCGVKNFPLILFFIICKKQQGEGLSGSND